MASGHGPSERQIIGILNVFDLQVPTVLTAQSYDYHHLIVQSNSPTV